MSNSFESLSADLDVVSKHSHYQTLHPLVHKQFDVPDSYRPRKMLEHQRVDFVKRFLSMQGKRVVDIGANTGYFSLAAADGGAARVDAIEGNAEHATFLSRCVDALKMNDRVFVSNRYVNFAPYDVGHADVVLCYNVLHHLGDDFRGGVEKDDALRGMAEALRQLVLRNANVVFQMGYNWQGDPGLPLTENGTKTEIIDFVSASLDSVKADVIVGCYDPAADAYVEANETNLGRFDALGEFANRPLFIISRQGN